jgi:hypothetical protein
MGRASTSWRVRVALGWFGLAIAACGAPDRGATRAPSPLADAPAEGDDESPCTATDWYADADGDGHGDAERVTTDCVQPDGAVASGDDCDDTRADVHPGAQEMCDGTLDEDCDGVIDETGAADTTLWFRDADGDGYGAPDEIERACAAPAGHVADDSDCDDDRADVNPGVAEICDDGLTDEDCDGSTDEPSAQGAIDLFLDGDGDGYGDFDVAARGCSEYPPWIEEGGDCDDTRVDVHPDANEVCDGETDEDCDGEVDEDSALGTAAWYADIDGDTYGDASTLTASCEIPESGAAEAGDCDDTRADAYPGAVESCTGGMDEDCDALIDCEDADCATDSACIEASCSDGLDDDNDGATDCADDDCWGTAGCGETVRVALLGGTVTIAVRDAPGTGSDHAWVDARALSGTVTRWVSSTTSTCAFTVGRASFSGAVPASGAATLPRHIRTDFAVSSACGVGTDFLPTTLQLSSGTAGSTRGGFPLDRSSAWPAWYAGAASGAWSTSSTAGFQVALTPQAATFTR